ncbi:unnamed protein product [Cuscuta europaea]|uniref:Uncharacterized protein n=1 Tax=Cuscuta europaea TaxID=41803 RepID=A0A9P1EP32_CUSEU|nr:unnamed protein product [Cuscuta europaea]
MGHDVCLTRSLQKGQLGVNPRLSQSVDRFLQITRDFNGSLLEGGLVACSGKPKAWSRSPSEFRGMACPTPTPFWNAASVLSMRVVGASDFHLICPLIFCVCLMYDMRPSVCSSASKL